MIRFTKNLRLLLKPPKGTIGYCCAAKQSPMSKLIKYTMATSQQQQKADTHGYENEKDIFRPGQAILDQHPQGYGYYDWNDQNSYAKAIQDQYYLNDLIIGFRSLRNSNPNYTQQHLAFMVYVMILFPYYQPEIMQEFVPAFIRFEERPDSHKNCAQYINLAKVLCYDPKWICNYTKSEELTKTISIYLRKRVLHPDNRKSLDCIHRSISVNCYEYMGGLEDILSDFKNIFFKECIETNYKVSVKSIKLSVSIYQKLMLLDPNLKTIDFFRAFPPTFEKNQQTFINMIDLLMSMLSFNFIVFVNENDLLDLNLRISKLRFKSRDTKDILRNYSEHLVLVGKSDLINFQNLLDFM